jgi:glucokinase
MSERFIVGIDLGGTNLKTALIDLRYKIRNKVFLSTQDFRSKEKLIQAIISSINSIIKENKLKKKVILGIGLGLPGPVDEKQGIVHFFPNIPGWKEVKLKSILEKKMGLAVFIDNDAKLMTLAEYRLGRNYGFKNILCLTLGTGVGGGIIISEGLYRGANNAAGEVGHIPINENGPLCNCGGIACLEAYIGNNRIKSQGKKLFKREISLEELSILAKRKNRLATKVWQDVGYHLGIALTGIVNLLNLDAIIIGGGVAGVGRILFDKVRKTVRERAMSVQSKHVKIYKAKFRNDAGLIGAAVMVKDALKI